VTASTWLSLLDCLTGFADRLHDVLCDSINMAITA